MHRSFASVALLCAASVLPGCASIVSGHNQSLSVNTRNEVGDLTGAKCTLNNDKGTWYVTTPGSVIVRRSYEDLSVACTAEGEAAGTASVKSSTKGMAFGNILFGGVIGAGVDVATGAAYDYPTLILVNLGKVVQPPGEKSAAASTPGAAQ